MKKLFAILLLLCLLPAALAEEAPALPAVNWSDAEAGAAEIEGRFTSLGNTGLMMYIPSAFQEAELAAEQLESGYFLLMAAEDGSCILNGQVLPITAGIFKDSLAASGAAVEDCLLNGVPVVRFELSADGTAACGIAYSTTQGDRIIVFNFAPVTPDNVRIVHTMIASLQPVR